jgi:hypothetical protein
MTPVIENGRHIGSIRLGKWQDGQPCWQAYVLVKGRGELPAGIYASERDAEKAVRKAAAGQVGH